MQILLVDDDDAVRGVIDRVLTRMGHEVMNCATAAEAESASVKDFQMALVDLNLGAGQDHDGWALVERLKERRPRACFVLTSGAPLSVPEDREAPLFLKKPFSKGDLVALVETARGYIEQPSL